MPNKFPKITSLFSLWREHIILNINTFLKDTFFIEGSGGVL